MKHQSAKWCLLLLCVVYFTGFERRGARIPPDMGAFVAHVFPANTWRSRESPDPDGLSFRVQHDGGLGPAAFVLWAEFGTIDV